MDKGARLESAAPIQHIWCSAAISQKMADVLIGYICNQAQTGKNIAEYIVYLSTLGGSPFSAVVLYNFIKSISQKTTVYNMGTVASAGVPVFLAFQNRVGVPGCSFMIHPTTIPKAILPDQLSALDLKTQENNLQATDDKTHLIIERETQQRAKMRLTIREIAAFASESKTFTEVEGLEYGFIERVAQPQLPASGVIYVTDQYLATLPGKGVD